jgi:hypothetical protein
MEIRSKAGGTILEAFPFEPQRHAKSAMLFISYVDAHADIPTISSSMSSHNRYAFHIKIAKLPIKIATSKMLPMATSS